jgi:hypothetical protein
MAEEGATPVVGVSVVVVVCVCVCACVCVCVCVCVCRQQHTGASDSGVTARPGA